MYVMLRLGTGDNRKSMNLQLVPTMFVVWKSTEKKTVSTGFKTVASCSTLQARRFEMILVWVNCDIWQITGALKS